MLGTKHHACHSLREKEEKTMSMYHTFDSRQQFKGCRARVLTINSHQEKNLSMLPLGLVLSFSIVRPHIVLNARPMALKFFPAMICELWVQGATFLLPEDVAKS